MWLCFYGLKDFCHYFLNAHPGYYITPLRLNGSAIETLFSQLKEGSGGTLSAVSYSSARAKLITKQAVHGPKVTESYRDAPLYVSDNELPIKRKSRKLE